MWLSVWTRAVVVPAWRRASAVWIGAGVGGGIVFGPTGMHPHDLTRLALGVPAVGAVLAVTWLLLFVPTARVLVRADRARYLSSLPGPRWSPIVVGVLAFVALQLPWLALWVAGDGARGLAVVLGLSVVIAGVAAIHPRARRARFPRWTRAGQGLRGVYVRALRRRASDALVRGVGLAIFAGLVTALFVHNNHLVGRHVGPLCAGTIAIMLIPGWVGVLLPLVEAQRHSMWLASSLGMSMASRVFVLATVVVGIYVAGAAIAVGAAAVALEVVLVPDAGAAAPASTIAWLGATTIATSLGIALLATRALVRVAAGGRSERALARDEYAVHDERDERGTAVRVVGGAVVASASSVLFLGWLGIVGAAVFVLYAACMLLTARPS